MFTNETEWKAAYDAADAVLSSAIARGDLEVSAGRPWNATVRQIAIQAATAVIRAGGEQPDGDISDTVPIETDKEFQGLFD